MANYIITLDPATYSSSGQAELALTNAGLAITKTYKFPLTYGATGTTAQIASLAGVTRYEETATELTPTASDIANYDHLQTTAVNPNYNFYWHPLDTSCGAGQHVYLMDTGVNTGHQEFGEDHPQINHLYNCASATGFIDSHGHGTGIASIIVGQSIGAASNATLHNVKMIDSYDNAITVGELVDALDEIITHHQANDASKPKVVCLPWTMTKNQLVDDKVNEMLAENLMVVASTGNRGNGVDVDDYSPGGLDTITTVGAHDGSFEVTSFTQLPLQDYVDEETTPIVRKLVQSAAEVDIFAIGVDVSTADYANVANYTSSTGSSPAAAMTAAIATHFMNLYSSTSAETIKSYMVTRGHEMAKLRRVSSSSEQHQTFLTYDKLVFPEGKTADWNKISLSMLSCPMSSQVSFTSIPSGRLVNIQHGQTVTVDIGLSENVSNVAVLDFSPLSPWMSFDASTGIFTADTSNASTAPASIAPGIYHFAIRGQVGDTVHVEEYSVGVYETAESELNSSTEYYWDDDENAYEEVVSYVLQGATQIK